ncbi:50S ribosome-binding GTPase [Microcystis elabens FACHB-917]|nr:50S ribosome-binding GTPase [Microcystis elabens FACHB-917]
MPNTGKSTLYNRLTGGDAQIANWPGLTVELPGIHDLSGSSEDEAVVQRFLRNTPPDLVLVVLNASQIASQLRLLLQIQQLGLPVVAALNMSDVARRFGLAIDHRGLSQDLGLPVHPESVRHNQGITALLDQLHRWGETPRPAGPAPVAGQGDPQAGPGRSAAGGPGGPPRDAAGAPAPSPHPPGGSRPAPSPAGCGAVPGDRAGGVPGALRRHRSTAGPAGNRTGLDPGQLTGGELGSDLSAPDLRVLRPDGHHRGFGLSAAVRLSDRWLHALAGAGWTRCLRLRDPRRIDRLLLVLAIAVLVSSLKCYTVSLDGLRHQVNPHWQRGT